MSEFVDSSQVNTGVLTCPACADRRVHNGAEWRDFHPLAGHGFLEGHGWTLPELDPHAQPSSDTAAGDAASA